MPSCAHARGCGTVAIDRPSGSQTRGAIDRSIIDPSVILLLPSSSVCRSRRMRGATREPNRTRRRLDSDRAAPRRASLPKDRRQRDTRGRTGDREGHAALRGAAPRERTNVVGSIRPRSGRASRVASKTKNMPELSIMLVTWHHACYMTRHDMASYDMASHDMAWHRMTSP